MNKLNLLCLIIIVLLIGCNSGGGAGGSSEQVPSTKSNIPTNSPNTTSSTEEFSYQTTSLFQKEVILLNEDMSLAANKKVDLYYDEYINTNFIGTMKTNNDAKLSLSVPVPNHVSKLRLVYTGVQSKVIKTIFISNKQIGHWLDRALNILFPKAYAQEVNDYTQEMYFPSKCSYGTLGFEDLWPSQGDYDFNDFVVNYNVAQFLNDTDHVKKMEFTFQFTAYGAGYKNGFAIELPILANQVEKVEGNLVTDNYIQFNENGTEAGHEKAVLIISDDISQQLDHFTNVFEGSETVVPYEFKVTVFFQDGVEKNALAMPPYNPFIIVNKKRGREVHLPDYSPTALADSNLWNEEHDDSHPASGRFYKDSLDRPWAIHIPMAFNHMKERSHIKLGHSKFLTWAESKGVQYKDWYTAKDGYRNNNFIFQKTIQPNVNPLISCEDPENSTVVSVRDGVETEETVDNVQSFEIDDETGKYEDTFNTSISFEPFDTMDGERELLFAKVRYKLSPSVNIIGKNIDGRLNGSAKVETSQESSLSWDQGNLATDIFERQTDFEKLPPGTLDEYVKYLRNGDHYDHFPNQQYLEEFNGQLTFSGADLTPFLAENPINFKISHSVAAEVIEAIGDQVSLDTNFRLQGLISIKYVWREYGSSGVKFNDSNLEIALRQKLGIWSGGVSSTHCQGLESLDLSSKNISDLKGLEICKDLTNLNLGRNNLTNLDILTKLTNLTHLNLERNQIVDLSALSTLTNLKVLNLSRNKLVDLSDLSTLVNLTNLILNNNEIVDISPLKDLTSLVLLYLDGNEIIDLSHLSNLINLQYLHLQKNNIAEASPLGSLVNLKNLRLNNNKITKIDWVTTLTNLSLLSLSSNKLTVLTDLSNLIKLTALYISYNDISDLSPIFPIKTNLKSIQMYDTNIVNTSQLKGFSALKYLWISNLNFNWEDLIDSKDTLQKAFIWNVVMENYTKIEEFLKLIELTIGNSNLTDINPLTKLTLMQKLNLYYNNLEDISLLKGIYENLKYLNVQNNPNLNCNSINTLWYYKFRKIDTRWNNEPENCEITEVDPLTQFESIFADANLDYEVRNMIDKLTGDLVVTDLENYSSLNVSNKSIESISGIEKWTHLTNLNLSNNSFTEFQLISGLNNLVDLNLSNTSLGDLSILENMEKLESLNITNTSVTDLSNLNNLTSLKTLNATGLSLECSQMTIINSLIDREVEISITPLTDCETNNSLISEEESFASVLQHSGTDLVSSELAYENSTEEVIEFTPFDSQEGTFTLKEVVITFEISTNISGLAKNFNSDEPQSGHLSVDTAFELVNLQKSDVDTSEENLILNDQLSHNFTNIETSTVEEYEDYRNDGSNAELFEEQTQSNSQTITLSFKNNLDYFQNGGEVNFTLKLKSSVVSKDLEELLLFDYSNNADIKAKVEYKYE